MLVAFLVLAGANPTLATPADPIEAGFSRPPASARPWVHWFWLDGNITRAGITADLEAMERVGIGGVVLMDLTQQIPPGPVRFGSPQWYDMFRHTVAEADRLGLEVSMHNGPGWCGSGGPWVTPEKAMQKLVSARTNITGPFLFNGPLPRLPAVSNYVGDIATIAFPTLVGDGGRVPGFAPKIHTSTGQQPDAGKLLDGKRNSVFKLTRPTSRKAQYIQLDFDQPFAASHLELDGGSQSQSFQGVLQASTNGRSFFDLRQFLNRGNGVEVDFVQISARSFRINFTAAQSASPALEFSELRLSPNYRIESAAAKSGLGRAKIQPIGNVPAFAVIMPAQIVDLRGRIDERGNLVWPVPAGQWTILRFGHTPVGRLNHPTAPEAQGLECDKLSKEAIESHFNSYLRKLIETGPAGARSFRGTHIDSWEHGYQNWTPQFPEEFRKRRGYDLLRYLPACTGRIVQSPEVSERFLWDMRRTIADVWADNYAGRLAELAHQYGMSLSIEAYANGPLDYLLYAGRADIPMSEFWAEKDDFGRFKTTRCMASAAHTYGKPIVAAEAFTAYSQPARWQNHPFLLKPLGDAQFCAGVNRMVFHRYAHQPWLDLVPGMTMGPWGVHYERTETWWEMSRPWHEYLARCQFLLQQGLFVADVCYLTDEGAFNDPTPVEKLHPPPPDGYNYDLITPEAVINRMNVSHGRLTLPDGMSYRLLVLPDTRTMTPRLLDKIRQLLAFGAQIVGPKPVKSPSLEGFPECDDKVNKIADQLWGNLDGKRVQQRPASGGKLFLGKPLHEVLLELGAGRDFEQLTTTSGFPLRWIHRRIGDAEFYFVANSNSSPVTAECAFRVSGRQPELWWPDSGQVTSVATGREQKGRTIVPLTLDPAGSVFVVFRKPAAGDRVVSVRRDRTADNAASVTIDAEGKLGLSAGRALYEVRLASGRVFEADARSLPGARTIDGPWEVRFQGRGAPEKVTFERLISWPEHPAAGVKYFSGQATYLRTFNVPSNYFGYQQYLDLGRVEVMAEVKLNGNDLGILWKAPFRVEITDALNPGANQLEIKVVNLWPNRLIGDEALPEDCQWKPVEQGSNLVTWPRWVLEGKPSPTGRHTFATWKHWHKGDPLLPSGLLGPVNVSVEKHFEFTPK